MPANRPPDSPAGGAMVAPPWSPIAAAARAPGPSQGVAAPLVALAVAAAGGLAVLLAPASGTDLAAQRARAAFAAAHPGAAVDLRWFGGVFPAAYSVVTPYVEAVVGARLTGVLAAVAGAPLLALLLQRWRARRVVWASMWGALALVADMVSGRTAFALGLTVAIAALVAVPDAGARRSRWLPPVVLAALTSLTSPVAALFLALAAVTWALVRRPVAVLAVAAAVPIAVIAALFAEPGRMPDTWAVARPVLIACAAVAVLCRGRPVRAAAVVYGAGAAVVFAWSGPIGSNVERLALLFTGLVLIAASWLPRILLVVAVLVAAQWTARVPIADVRHAHRLAVEQASAQRLVGILASLGPAQGRIEVVPFADHGEADVVAQAWPLARGWERQVDVVRAGPLYRHDLDATRYRGWLDGADVQLVAVGRHAHDWSATGELRLLAHPPPWLAVVHADAEWTVWQVAQFRPLAGAGARVVLAAADRLVLDLPRPGRYPVGVRWSRWLTASRGACVRRSGPRTELVARRAGTVTVTSSYLAPLTGRHC